MKIIKETPSRLVLQQKFFSAFSIYWALGFGAIPLFMVVWLLFNMGVTTLSCQRVQPTLINCFKSESRFLGLMQQPASDLKNVTSAKYNSKTYTDSDGDRQQEYWVSVIAKGREVRVFGGDGRETNAIATKINLFINSNEPFLLVRQDRRWRLSNLSVLFPLSFMAIPIFILNFVFKIQTFIFDKNSPTLTYRQRKLLGVKSRSHEFGNIAKIEVEESVDSDDDKHYKLSLLLPSASTNYLLMDCHEQVLPEVEKMAQKLSDLTGVLVSKKLKNGN